MTRLRPEQRKSLPTGRKATARPPRVLHRDMTCEAALCAIARGSAADLRHHSPAAARGDGNAVHHIRIALTRLRTAIRFFKPAFDTQAWQSLSANASWLSRQSGPARDIDVALERQRKKNAADAPMRPWRKERDRLYRHVQRSFRSTRCKQFIEALAKLASLPEHDTNEAASAGGFATERLERWRRKLIKRGRKLDRLGEKKRHRLRLRAKRFRYAAEWSLPILQTPPALTREDIKQAKAIQDALGPLNDSFTHLSQAKALKIDPLPAMVRLDREKPQTRRLKTAARAVKKLARSH